MEAEQAVLGALLYDPDTVLRLPHGFNLTHFHEPFHQRLFALIQRSADAGATIDGILSGALLGSDKAFRELGGTNYIGALVERSPGAGKVPEYAKTLIGLGVRRGLIRISDETKLDAMEGEIPPDELLHQTERAVTGLRISDQSLQLISASEAIDRVFAQLDNAEGADEGILSGLEPLDKLLGVQVPGDLIVLGGRPSMGKSALASVWAQNVAMAGHGVIEINGEMSVEQMMRRHLTSIAYSIAAAQTPAYSAIRNRHVEYAQRQVLEKAAAIIRQLPMMSLKKTGLTLGTLRSLVRRQAADWDRVGIKVRLLVVDHVGLIKTGEKSRGRTEDQTVISGELKELCGDLDLVGLALAQLNRKVEERDDKRPTLPDLRDSGSWEQDADAVIGVYRDAYYAVREKEPKTGTAAQDIAWSDWDARRKSRAIEAILLKVREGETNTAELWGDIRTNTILGREPETYGGFI